LFDVVDAQEEVREDYSELLSRAPSVVAVEQILLLHFAHREQQTLPYYPMWTDYMFALPVRLYLSDTRAQVGRLQLLFGYTYPCFFTQLSMMLMLLAAVTWQFAAA
jgi:hypothetical protein